MAAKTKALPKAKSRKKSSVAKRSESTDTSSWETMSLEESGKKKKYSYKYLVVGVFVILILALAYVMKGYFVAAMVNGRPISRLALIKQLEQASGQQTLESLVAKELIAQEARKRNVVVNMEDIKPDLEGISKQLEGEGTTLDAALATRGMTMADFEENLKMQKTVEKLLVEETQVSDEELLKYFEENKQLYGENPKYEDLKDDLKEQLKQDKLNAEYEEFYNKLKSESDIKYYASF